MSFDIRGGIRFRNRDHCPCCGGESLRTVLRQAADFESGLGHFDVHECSSCSIQFTDPQPVPEDLPLLYGDRESHDFDSSGRFVDQLRRFNNRRQLRRLPARILENNVAALDYGCGSGFFTKTMRGLLPGRVIASDFHESPPPDIAGAENIEYVQDRDVDSLSGELDVVICRNVLEHSIDPLTFIERLRDLLRPGGVILIEVPNRRSRWTRLLGQYSFNYYLPRHTYHYDESALARQLQGFRVVGRWFDHSPILGKSVGNILGTKISGFGGLGLVLLPLQMAVDVGPGVSSQLVAVAERV